MMDTHACRHTHTHNGATQGKTHLTRGGEEEREGEWVSTW